MYEILIPVDQDTERAHSQVDYVTSRPGSEETSATVLHVTPREESPEGKREFDEVDAAVEAANRLEEAGVDVRRAADVGTVTRKIEEYADEHSAEEIIMSGRKRSGVQKVLVGSVTQDVIFSTDLPVIITD